jgi:glycosyltransferase involved in cell wall biosynthesis
LPGISVVIPAYNQPQMLAQALAGVEAQTLPAGEVVVIDDCSREPLERATERSPGLPVRFVRQEVNLGPAGSVVHGLREARGELVAVLNHDDAWEPRYLERLAAALAAEPDAGFAFCDHGIMRAAGEHDEQLSAAQSERFGRARLAGGTLRGAALYQAALLDKAVAASSFALARRDALDVELIAAGADMWDYFTTVGATRRSGAAVYVDERLGWYRFSPTMLTTTWIDPRKQIEMARPLTLIHVFMLRSPQFAPVHAQIRTRLVLAVRHALAAGLRTRSPVGVARAAARISAGARQATRLLAREQAAGVHTR